MFPLPRIQQREVHCAVAVTLSGKYLSMRKNFCVGVGWVLVPVTARRHMPRQLLNLSLPRLSAKIRLLLVGPRLPPQCRHTCTEVVILLSSLCDLSGHLGSF